MSTGLQLARLGCMLFVTLIVTATRAPAQTMDEYQVKAGFVSSFANFVEWPAESFKGPHEPITICVFGQNPFGTALGDLVGGKTAAGRPLVVRQLVEMHLANECHILFVSSSEHLRLRAILESLGDQSVFSVGDTSDFIAEGGIVNLRTDGGRVSIEINAQAAGRKHIRISSRLLQLAKSVNH